jgi:hypothetical protein
LLYHERTIRDNTGRRRRRRRRRTKRKDNTTHANKQTSKNLKYGFGLSLSGLMRSFVSLSHSRIGCYSGEREREAVEEEEEKSGERFEVDLVFFFSAFINDYCC